MPADLDGGPLRVADTAVGLFYGHNINNSLVSDDQPSGLMGVASPGAGGVPGGAWRAADRCSGSRARTMVPFPSSEVIVSVPPWLSTIVRTIASPSPVPGMDRSVALDARKNRVNRSF